MQTSNSTGQDTRYTVESGRGPDKPLPKLLGAALTGSHELGPYSYTATANGKPGRVTFFVQENNQWVFAATGEFQDTSALVTFVGQPGEYRVEVAYPQLL